jgi:hypothetical protein
MARCSYLCFSLHCIRFCRGSRQGGTIMATSPDRGVVNLHQQHWDVSNLFVIGAFTFPPTAAQRIPHQQSGLSGTGFSLGGLVEALLLLPQPNPTG